MSSKNGMFYHKSSGTNIKEAAWWEEQCVRRQGGYDFDKSNLPATFRWLPKGSVLKINKATGKVALVKSAEVAAKANAQATTLKIKDNGLFAVGDKIAGSTISNIAIANGVATLTVTALAATVEAGDAVSEYDPEADTLIGLAYETTDLRDNDFPQVTPTLVAMEIEKDTMPYPVNDAIIEGLNKAGVGTHLFRVL